MTLQPIDDAHGAVQHYEPVYAPANPTGGRIVAWAEAARSAASLGVSLSKTSFVPKDFRGKPEECAAAILYGDEIGLTPMQSLQAIYVIGGRPGLYAKAMLAVVLAAGHEVETVSKSDAKVVVRGRRKGSETWIEETWTTERARRAGYTNNKKYETDPQAMLLARAQSDVCRQIAADALAGLTYSVEELELAEEAPTARVTRSKAPTGTRVQRAAIAATEEPSFVKIGGTTFTADVVEAEIVHIVEKAEDIAEAVEEQVADGITASQSKMLHASLKEHGYADREAGLAYIAWVLGREVASTKDLTKADASKVIDSLVSQVEIEEPTFDEGDAA